MFGIEFHTVFLIIILPQTEYPSMHEKKNEITQKVKLNKHKKKKILDDSIDKKEVNCKDTKRSKRNILSFEQKQEKKKKKRVKGYIFIK